ncbi:hypothetical protein BT63DRAFT_78202 [Microthyrium microscopicum]|uniref:Uncharacterized protein n=1 Tax=Microthyrium microscopicum TaxID=703497 RepID=A0A6A6TXQ1_9PEZI|nr:hypothetical protein BT63DRAFT_78202 [Microthyrium microscopicum]
MSSPTVLAGPQIWLHIDMEQFSKLTTSARKDTAQTPPIDLYVYKADGSKVLIGRKFPIAILHHLAPGTREWTIKAKTLPKEYTFKAGTVDVFACQKILSWLRDQFPPRADLHHGSKQVTLVSYDETLSWYVTCQTLGLRRCCSSIGQLLKFYSQFSLSDQQIRRSIVLLDLQSELAYTILGNYISNSPIVKQLKARQAAEREKSLVATLKVSMEALSQVKPKYRTKEIEELVALVKKHL